MTLEAHINVRKLVDHDLIGLYSRLDLLSRLNYGVPFEELLSKHSRKACRLLESLTYNHVFLVDVLVKIMELRELCERFPRYKLALSPSNVGLSAEF